MDELTKAWSEAYSIESIPKDAGRLTYIGQKIREDRIYIFYRDANWRYWYRVQIITDKGVLSEWESIFGTRRRK